MHYLSRPSSYSRCCFDAVILGRRGLRRAIALANSVTGRNLGPGSRQPPASTTAVLASWPPGVSSYRTRLPSWVARLKTLAPHLRASSVSGRSRTTPRTGSAQPPPAQVGGVPGMSASVPERRRPRPATDRRRPTAVWPVPARVGHARQGGHAPQVRSAATFFSASCAARSSVSPSAPATPTAPMISPSSMVIGYPPGAKSSWLSTT